jgi:hypothetical protein
MPKFSGGSLVDMVRMEEAASVAGRSAEALLGYISRLDALRAPEAGVSEAALADRAANAELHARMVLSAGLDAVNELHDLGLLEHSMRSVASDLEGLNKVTLADTLDEIAKLFQERLPAQRWDWLRTAGKLVEGVELKIEADDAGLRGVVAHSGRSTTVRFAMERPATRTTIAAFFSTAPNRIYVPAASAVSRRTSDVPMPVAAYDAMLGGMAFAREWVYRHARNAAELGPPTRTGGGPVLVVVAIVLVVIALVAAVAAAIFGFACALGSDFSCKWAAYLSVIGIILTGSAKGIDSQTGQNSTATVNNMMYGTNTQ